MPTYENIQRMLDTLEASFKKLRPHLLETAGKTVHEDKLDGSPVTEVDIYAEKVIKSDLEKICGSIPVVGEESGYLEDSLPESVWIIDPIDGTKSFLKAEPYYTNMAVLIHKEEAIACCIYNPSTNDVYRAVKDQGAYKNDLRLDLGACMLPKTIFCKGRFIPHLEAILEDSKAVVPPEGAGSTFSQIADGLVAARFQIAGPGHLHDYATGALLVREAGGELIDFSNEDYSIHSKSFVACHPALAGRIREHLAEIRELEKLQSK